MAFAVPDQDTAESQQTGDRVGFTLQCSDSGRGDDFLHQVEPGHLASDQHSGKAIGAEAVASGGRIVMDTMEDPSNSLKNTREYI